MTPLQMSAQYNAYLWFTRQADNLDKSREDAHQFARLNWEKFLPSAHEGFGRLLMRMVRVRTKRSRRVMLAACN